MFRKKSELVYSGAFMSGGGRFLFDIYTLEDISSIVILNAYNELEDIVTIKSDLIYNNIEAISTEKLENEMASYYKLKKLHIEKRFSERLRTVLDKKIFATLKVFNSSDKQTGLVELFVLNEHNILILGTIDKFKNSKIRFIGFRSYIDSSGKIDLKAFKVSIAELFNCRDYNFKF